MLCQWRTDKDTLAKLRGINISQENNPNSYTLLWESKIFIDNKRLAFKEFLNPDTQMARDNINTLLEIGSRTELTKIPELVLPIHLIISDEDCIGYTMEFIDGCTLSEFLKTSTSVQALRIFDRLADVLKRIIALPFAFYLSDLHEENVFICRETEELRLIDIDSVFIQGQTNYESRYPSFMLNTLLLFPNKYKTDSNGVFCASAELDILCLQNIIINYVAQTDFFISVLPWCEIANYISYLKQFKSMRGFARSFLKIASANTNTYHCISPICFENDFPLLSYAEFKKRTGYYKNEHDAQDFLSQHKMGSF